MRTAIITGATSGIGRSFAELFAAKGLNLIISGRREEMLRAFAKETEEKYQVKVTVSVGDLSDRKYVDFFDELIDELSDVEYLVNNAGYGNRDSFFKGEFAEQSKMIDVHIYALTRFVHTIGNKMKEQGYGNIINTSSLASFFPIPTGEFYCSTKAFINTFSESTYIDLRRFGIKVQALCPGYTYTDFHKKLQIDDSKRVNTFLIRWMSADRVAELSIKALQRKERVIYVPGITNKVLYIFSKFIPKGLYYRYSANSIKVPGKKEV